MKAWKTFLCLGYCERGVIPHESTVKAQIGAFTLLPGDLAVFAKKNQFACHRILYKRRFGDLTWYYLSPDHGPPDGWVPAYQMEGRVVEINGVAVASHWRFARLIWGRLRTFAYHAYFSQHWGRRLWMWLNDPIL